MKKKLITLFCLIGVVTVYCVSTGRGQRKTLQKPVDPRPNAVSKFMQVKLRHSQSVLEGLALEDYDRIAKHSQEIALLSQATNWQVLQTPKYLEHSMEFRRTANSLTEAARKKNLDGAALSYVEMTLKCVNCHKYVRRIRNASHDPPAELRLPEFE